MNAFRWITTPSIGKGLAAFLVLIGALHCGDVRPGDLDAESLPLVPLVARRARPGRRDAAYLTSLDCGGLHVAQKSESR